jgi:hypothetical protein
MGAGEATSLVVFREESSSKEGMVVVSLEKRTNPCVLNSRQLIFNLSFLTAVFLSFLMAVAFLTRKKPTRKKPKSFIYRVTGGIRPSTD